MTWRNGTTGAAIRFGSKSTSESSGDLVKGRHECDNEKKPQLTFVELIHRKRFKEQTCGHSKWQRPCAACLLFLFFFRRGLGTDFKRVVHSRRVGDKAGMHGRNGARADETGCRSGGVAYEHNTLSIYKNHGLRGFQVCTAFNPNVKVGLFCDKGIIVPTELCLLCVRARV